MVILSQKKGINLINTVATKPVTYKNKMCIQDHIQSCICVFLIWRGVKETDPLP